MNSLLKHIIKTIILILISLAVSQPAFSHRKSPRKEKKEKMASVSKENSDKEEKKRQLKESRERHDSIQDKKTRKRMKQTKKKSMIHAGHKKPPFYKRWFRRKR